MQWFMGEVPLLLVAVVYMIPSWRMMKDLHTALLDVILEIYFAPPSTE